MYTCDAHLYALIVQTIYLWMKLIFLFIFNIFIQNSLGWYWNNYVYGY